MSGCIIPVAPDFQDPVGSLNYSPRLIEETPAFGDIRTITVSQEYTLQAVDPNLSDTLYVRWLADYPGNSSRLLQSDAKSQNLDGMPQSFAVTVGCAQGSVVPNTTNLHRLEVVVSDGAFTSDIMLDQISDTALAARADWTFYLTCSTTP